MKFPAPAAQAQTPMAVVAPLIVQGAGDWSYQPGSQPADAAKDGAKHAAPGINAMPPSASAPFMLFQNPATAAATLEMPRPQLA